MCPFVAIIFESTGATILPLYRKFLIFRQFFFVIYVKRNQNIILFKIRFNTRFWPNMFLHFAAVDTSIAGKIQKNGLVDFLGICYALFQILEAVEVIWAIVGVEEAVPNRWCQTAKQCKWGECFCRFVDSKARCQIHNKCKN